MTITDKQSRTLKKYLGRYAESEIQSLKTFPSDQYQNALIIPAYAEKAQFLQRLEDHGPESGAFKYLLILVSNHPLGVTNPTFDLALQRHEEISQWLGKATWISRNLSLYNRKNFDILLVNRTGQHALPPKEGVGLARKIGADIAAALFVDGFLVNPWIMSTDADTHLPSDYFEINPPDNCSALSYSFNHLITDDSVGKATELYESRIQHYVNGLVRAGSSYAFHTVGSAHAINLYAYAQVRGYPKKSAGEDFYLLNKLAKVGPIEQPAKPVILIESRLSDRVPFGTGPSVKKLLDSPDMFAEPIFYDPKIFDCLKQVLDSFKPVLLNDVSHNLLDLPRNTQQCLSELGIEAAIEHARKQSLSDKQLGKHMQDWFDGFRTLRFVHLMRDLSYPPISWNELEQQKSTP